jgi:sugar phosphate isomerase/epimerase
MNVTSAFVDWQSIGNPTASNAPKFDDILERAQELNLKHLVYGYIGKGHRETPDQFKGHAERANTAGEKCKAVGIQLCYHNHSFEFQPLSGDKAGIDILVDEFDPQLVKFELDVFWAQIGGRDPLQMIKRLRGRISQLHLKDLLAGTEIQYDEGAVPPDAFQELGDGVIDMAEIMKAGEVAGVEQCHVEQDQSPAPLQSIVQSLKYLNALA